MSSEVRQIRLDDIAVSERVGFYHPEHAAGLAESIKAIGLQSPVHVRRNDNRAERPWRLVAGLHRLRACELLDWGSVSAIQVAGESSDAAELLRLELSENLDHRRPRPIERAMFVAARARLEEGEDYADSIDEPSQVRAAKARWNASANPDPIGEKTTEDQVCNADANLASASNWRQRTRDAMGISERTLMRLLQVHRHVIAPFSDLAEALNRHDAAQSLTALKKLADYAPKSPAKRRAVIELLLQPGNEAMTIEAAITQVKAAESKGKREPTDYGRESNSFLRKWQGFDLRLRRETACTIARLAPPSIRQAIRKELDDADARDGAG
ncbi:MAG: ParB N-terminal domain-containing protein [Sphingomonas sp.]|nr:ParB N-terminal domain-containing protein [Sphingomonas sp.]